MEKNPLVRCAGTSSHDGQGQSLFLLSRVECCDSQLKTVATGPVGWSTRPCVPLGPSPIRRAPSPKSALSLLTCCTRLAGNSRAAFLETPELAVWQVQNEVFSQRRVGLLRGVKVGCVLC